MSGVHVASNAYSYQRDRDAKGYFFWILDPSGHKIAYVDEEYLARNLIRHLNRES